jgi:hypothetical protein
LTLFVFQTNCMLWKTKQRERNWTNWNWLRWRRYYKTSIWHSRALMSLVHSKRCGVTPASVVLSIKMYYIYLLA